MKDSHRQLSAVVGVLDDVLEQRPSTRSRLFRRRSSAPKSPLVDKIARLDTEIAQLTARTIAARARYRAWARPIIAARRQLTPAETAHRSQALAEIDDLDQRLAAKAIELVEAAASYFSRRSARSEFS